MTEPEAHSSASDAFSAREVALARWVLVAVGASYLAIQFVLFSYRRASGWDESVYLSQVMPSMKALFYSASRARGITLLIAPAAWLSRSVSVVRFFLIVTSAIALIAAFWPWIRVVGMAAPVAAFLFGFSWMGLLNGSEIMPNLWAALLAIAVAGFVVRRIVGGTRRDMVFASVLLALLALFRPTEATVLAGALGLYIVVFKRSFWRILVPLSSGLVIGWLPWVIEMSVRFGGLRSALSQAGSSHFALVSVARNVNAYLAYASGGIRIVGLPASLKDVRLGEIWWAALLVMAIVAIARRSPATSLTAVVSAFMAAAALGAEYVVFGAARAPRFLLPAYGLAGIPAAVGLVSLMRGRLAFRAIGAAAFLVVIPWAVWQGSIADRVEAVYASNYDSYRDVGLAVHQLADGRPCTFLNKLGTPGIALVSGCDPGRLLWSRGASIAQVDQLQNSDQLVFVLLRKPALPGSPLGSVIPVRSLVTSDGRQWFVYEFPTSGM